MIAFLSVLGLAAAFTVPAVLLIPRQRHSPLFDRVLWGATWALAILGAYAAPNVLPATAPLTAWWVVDLPVMPTVIGALVGALSLNLLLWLMDRLSDSEADDHPAEAEAGEKPSPEEDAAHFPR